jgi:glyoxylase-like metal-dependent hydrolase (beta-lactamase superfamily II)
MDSMSVDFRVISIGALACNRLWGETQPVRTSHATTTLVTDDKKRILVDPSLPAAAISARYQERTGEPISKVTDVFCTTLRPVHRRSIEAFSKARWWACEAEIQTYSTYLDSLLRSAQRLDDTEAAQLRKDRELLERFQPAPDQFSRQVGLYPAHGASGGSAGLILTPATQTVLIAGDAVLTGEHYHKGQVWQGAQDRQAALASLKDIMEIADVIVPGHDNLLMVSRSWL